MGRDTGIEIRGDIKLPFWVRPCKELWEQPGVIDLCYWRNCHNLANQIVWDLGLGSDFGEKEVDAAEVEMIAKIVWEFFVRRFRNRLYSKRMLFWNYVNLRWLSHYLQQYSITVVFYDSF